MSADLCSTSGDEQMTSVQAWVVVVFPPVLGASAGVSRTLTEARGYYHQENLDILQKNHAFSCIICMILVSEPSFPQ